MILARKKADFEAEFKRLPVSEAKNLIQQIQNKTADEDKVLRENVVNIAGVSDANGNPLTFNQELLSQLAEQAYIRAPLLAGFMEVNYSLEKLREKTPTGRACAGLPAIGTRCNQPGRTGVFSWY